jgi:hypothetical protein
MINTDITIDGTPCSAENYRGLLHLMKDTNTRKVKCSFTLWGEEAHKATLTIDEVRRLAEEEI